MKLLLVEDEPRAAELLSKGLREQGYAVDVSASGRDALYRRSITDYDAIVLDVMLPGVDGFECAAGSAAPGRTRRSSC